MNEKQAYKNILNDIEKSLKLIHSPLCDMEKYAFDYENDEINNEVQNIHKGYMKILTAINTLRKLKGIENE